MLPLRCAFVDRLERWADCAVPRKRIQPFKAPECFATTVCWAIMYFWGPFNSSGCPCRPQVVARASAKPPLTGSRPGAHAGPAPGGLGPCPGPAARQRGLSMGAMAWKLPWGRPGRRPPCPAPTPPPSAPGAGGSATIIAGSPRSRAWQAGGHLPSCRSALGKPKVLVRGVQVLVSVSSHVKSFLPASPCAWRRRKEKAALQLGEPLQTW